MKSFWVFLMLLPLALFVLLQNITPVSTASSPQQNQFLAAANVRFAGDPAGVDPNLVHDQINRTRVDSGLAELTPDANLAELAQARAQDMVRQDYYAHQSPEGRYYYDEFKTYNVVAGYSCENLDMLTSTRAEQVVSDWLRSPRGHRECVLNQRITHAGYATVVIDGADQQGQPQQSSIVVAIYAELPTR